ncbi:MAG: 5'-methylthioadenosine/S-adenosylhomocysteine nucleosidase [Pseudomonadota bacterium]|nr:5'-methylthioadenosine/S-adenosylhomocysteine nucleosidase [Pseudomonadota bacterium]
MIRLYTPRLALAVGLGLFLTGCTTLAPTPATQAAQQKPVQHCLSDCQSRLAIMAAFGQEADLLLAQTTNKKTLTINGKTFTTGTLKGAPIVLVLSGIGMTNAVMTTQMLFDHFNVSGLIFSGIAGGMKPSLNVGDVVVARHWAAPNEIYHANDNTLPAPCGVAGDLACLGLKLMPNLPPYGDGMFLRETNVINANNAQNIALMDRVSGHAIAYGEMRADFPVDPNMLNTAASLKSSIEAELEPICSAPERCYQPQIIMGNRGIASGSFLANAQYRDYLAKHLDADAVDMETSGVAHVAYANQIPFIAFRSLSDLAGADHDPNVGAFFASGVAQRNAAKLTMAFIEQWIKTP